MITFYALLGLISFLISAAAVWPLMQKKTLPATLKYRLAIGITTLILLVGLGLYRFLGVPEIVAYTG